VFNPITGILLCKGPIVLYRKVNRIIVTARRKKDKDYAMHSYMIVLRRGKVSDKAKTNDGLSQHPVNTQGASKRP